MPENRDLWVDGPYGEVYAAFALPQADSWTEYGLGRFLTDLVYSATNEKTLHIGVIDTGDGQTYRRALLIEVRERPVVVAPRSAERQEEAVGRIDDDIQHLVSVAKKYGVKPVDREWADRLSQHIDLADSIRESGI